MFARPSVLDSFSSLSGHTNNLMKQLSGDRLPPLHTRVILPLMVSSDKDVELEVHQASYSQSQYSHTCLYSSQCRDRLRGVSL